MIVKNILRPLKSLTVYFSMPAYNLQWLRDFKFADAFLTHNPITVVDIGSRDGSCDELATLQKYSDYIGFDADQDSVNHDLEDSVSKWRTKKIITKFIGGEKANTLFNLYVRKSESSSLNPSKSYQTNFSQRLRIESQISVECDTLANVLNEHSVLPDLIKIDTQGTEYEIIKSSPEVFSDTLIVEIEAEFLEIYENQKLFPEVSCLMYTLGHQLLYVNRVFGNMNNGIVKTRGQLVFGDFLFGLRIERAIQLPTARKYKYCLLLINYGHIDFAYQLYMQDDLLKLNYPEVMREFEKHFKKPIHTKIVRGLITQLDKIVFIYLALRKTNGLHFDSDRSWPVR